VPLSMDNFFEILNLFFKNVRSITIYGLIIFSIIESIILIFFSGLKHTPEKIGVINKSIELQYKYGIYKSILPKIIILVLFAYPNVPKYPQFLLLFVYSIHTIVAVFHLLRAWANEIYTNKGKST
jgi:hypothetical protein